MKFNSTKEEYDLISKIVTRAEEMGIVHVTRRMTTLMDLDVAHSNGCPMGFAELLEAEPSEFSHDVAGIIQNIDRDTGKLRNFFVPRFAKPKAAVA